MRVDVALLLALCPVVAVAAPWPQPPVPKDAQVATVANSIVYNGVDMRAQTFRSGRSQGDVVAFYRKAWGRDAVVNAVGDAKVVAYKDGDYVITVQISGMGSGSKGTIGILDTASAKAGFQPGKGLPAPMGSTVFNDISYPDDPVPARTVAMVNTLSPMQNASYFRKRLQGDGWKPADANRCLDDSCVLRYQRGDSKLTLVMTRDGSRSQIVINQLRP